MHSAGGGGARPRPPPLPAGNSPAVPPPCQTRLRSWAGPGDGWGVEPAGLRGRGEAFLTRPPEPPRGAGAPMVGEESEGGEEDEDITDAREEEAEEEEEKAAEEMFQCWNCETSCHCDVESEDDFEAAPAPTVHREVRGAGASEPFCPEDRHAQVTARVRGATTVRRSSTRACWRSGRRGGAGASQGSSPPSAPAAPPWWRASRDSSST
jgi:hypothetical protein